MEMNKSIIEDGFADLTLPLVDETSLNVQIILIPSLFLLEFPYRNFLKIKTDLIKKRFMYKFETERDFIGK
jgi:hypothetical protein